MRVRRLALLDHLGVERRHRFAFSGDLGGDALEDLRRHMRIDQHGDFRLTKHVDESRRHDQAVGVDHLPGMRVGEVADRGDATILHGDIGRVPGRTRTVDDVAVADDGVVLDAGSRRWHRCRQPDGRDNRHASGANEDGHEPLPSKGHLSARRCPPSGGRRKALADARAFVRCGNRPLD